MDQPETTALATTSSAGFNWSKLLGWSAIASVVVVVLVNVFAGLIPPLIVFALLWIGGVVWLRSSTKGPSILLLVASLAFLITGAPFMIPTLTVPASAGDFILNLAALLAALAGVVSAIQVVRGQAERVGGARTVGLTGVALFVVGAVVSIFSTFTYDDAVRQEGDVAQVTKDIEFQNKSLEAEAGEISIFVENDDGTLHTFTIDELDVDLDVPASKSARVTFQAEPGTYKFYCVPHKGDMEGTLVVQ
jgi:plastocyanin